MNTRLLGLFHAIVKLIDWMYGNSRLWGVGVGAFMLASILLACSSGPASYRGAPSRGRFELFSEMLGGSRAEGGVHDVKIAIFGRKFQFVQADIQMLREYLQNNRRQAGEWKGRGWAGYISINDGEFFCELFSVEDREGVLVQGVYGAVLTDGSGNHSIIHFDLGKLFELTSVN